MVRCGRGDCGRRALSPAGSGAPGVAPGASGRRSTGACQPPPCSSRAGLRRFGVQGSLRAGSAEPVATKLCR